MIFNNEQGCIIVLIIVYSTCYYVLGLIAKTQQGVEILSELNWEGVISPNGAPEGLCVPQNLALFLAVSSLCDLFIMHYLITMLHHRSPIGNIPLHFQIHLFYQSQSPTIPLFQISSRILVT